MKNENNSNLDLKAKVKNLLAQGTHGGRIEAIALVQNHLKLGLKGSKDWVDELEEQGRKSNMSSQLNL